MGKWAQYSKRGSAPYFGSIAAPGPSGGDWTIGVATATTIPVTRVAAIPVNATQMLWRAINNATGAVTAPYNGTITGLVTGTTYRIQAAWWNGAQMVSADSVATLVTTA